MLLGAVATLAVAGCTAAGDGVSALAVPRPSAASCGSPPAGHYTGLIAGRELATAASVSPIRARLTIWPDGRWAMQTDSDRATGCLTCPRPDLLVLEGRFEDGAGGAAAAAWYRLARGNGDGVWSGSALAHFAGHTVWTGIQLERVDGPVASLQPPAAD